MRAFFNYYKWHILFFALFVICITAFALSSCQKSEADLKITCISTEYVNVQTFNDTKNDLEEFLHDSDGDNKKTAILSSHTVDTQSDLDEVAETLCTAEDCDIIITTKATFERFEKKDIFDTSTNYVWDTGTGKYEVLKDEQGRVYAVSIEGNEYLKNMGFLNTTDLYLAVVIEDSDSDNLPSTKKNARNIAQVIIKERDV